MWIIDDDFLSYPHLMCMGFGFGDPYHATYRGSFGLEFESSINSNTGPLGSGRSTTYGSENYFGIGFGFKFWPEPFPYEDILLEDVLKEYNLCRWNEIPMTQEQLCAQLIIALIAMRFG